VSERHVRPVHETTVRDRAAANRQRAVANRFVDGQPVADPKYVQAAMDALPPEYQADDNIANITQVIAAGLEYLDLRKSGGLRGKAGRGQGEPIFRESGGGRFDGGAGDLSDLDIAAAKARGKTPEQWAKMQKNVNKSSNRGTAILEDV
jgi:hypothetical protein